MFHINFVAEKITGKESLKLKIACLFKKKFARWIKQIGRLKKGCTTFKNKNVNINIFSLGNGEESNRNKSISIGNNGWWCR